LDDPAFGNAAAFARGQRVAQFVPQTRQRLDLLFRRIQMPRHELVHLFAWPFAMRSQLQEFTHVLDRESKLPRAPDEAEPFQMSAA
jgi:hypothetical protein